MLPLAETTATTWGPLAGSPVKWAVLLAMSLLWLWTCPKINRDALGIGRVHREAWALMYLLAGTAGLTVALLVPAFAIGVVLFVLFVAGTGTAYVLHRNGKVDEDSKLTFGSLLGGKGGASRGGAQEVHTHLQVYSSDGRAVNLTGEQAADAARVRGHNAAQVLLMDIVRNRASEVDLSPAGEVYRFRLVVDGVVTDQPPVPADQAVAAIDYLEHIANIDATEKSNPMKGKVSIDLDDKQVDMDIATATTQKGRRLQIRVIQELVRTDLDTLGMDEDMRQTVLGLLQQPGLLIVAGPPNRGTTSTVFSLLRKQDAYLQMLMTIEDKATVELENVTQLDYGEPNRLPDVLTSALRRDPEMLMADQCPDTQSARLLVDFASEHTALLCMRASDVFSAMGKWLTVVGSSSGILPVRGILCQTLIRRLCPDCKVAYKPDPALLKKMHLDASTVDTFHRPPKDDEKPRDKQEHIIPCPTCQDVGYFGRTGVFEFLPVADDLRQAVRQKTALAQVKGLARKLGYRSLKENALAKVVEGITSIQEVVRVFQSKSQS